MKSSLSSCCEGEELEVVKLEMLSNIAYIIFGFKPGLM